MPFSCFAHIVLGIGRFARHCLPRMISQLHITSSLLQELADGLRGAVFTPQFGEVYYGKLPNFGQGIPHNAMVRGALWRS